MKTLHLLKGLIKSIPGIEFLYRFNKSTGGSNSARYCYGVWLRHLSYAYKSGLSSVPEKVAELGPGDSFGTGMAALISGTKKYYAIDVVQYSNTDTNLQIFDELVSLFRQKAAIPDEKEFPKVRPLLDDYSFPSKYFTDEYLAEMLDEKRIADIRNQVILADRQNSPDNVITFATPDEAPATIGNGSLDMVLSQAVMQHVDELESAYKNMSVWLKEGGLISHDIDFKAMGSSDIWYGHWTYSDMEWNIIRGRKNFFINRASYSTHINLLKKNNFEIVCEKKTIADSPADAGKLAKRFRGLPKEDLSISNVFIQAKMKERVAT
jgi:SAM-dependent methyltransferase